MARGQFREDLYYRLSVFPIHLPPLRERGEDVVLLAQEFVRRLGERMGKGEPGLSRDARELLVTYPWPGNIRELQNAIERALIVSDAGLITAAQLGLTLPRLRSARRPFLVSPHCHASRIRMRRRRRRPFNSSNDTRSRMPSRSPRATRRPRRPRSGSPGCSSIRS